jgi:hypothetical protein
MTSWDSQLYTEGHLEQKGGSGWGFRMNYRLLHPESYDANFDPGYPIIIFLHGGGERGNCWGTDCYCTDCDPNATPDPNAIPQFMNNDHQLSLGGQFFQNAVQLAGSKKPGDPTLNAKAFPGFVLFPQNENSWGPATGSAPISHALRILRLVIKNYNIDPDRVYIAGLSFGGQGVYKALNLADWLFAAAITMSAVDFSNELEYDSIVTLPLWTFQGGNDLNPKPSQTEKLLKRFREAGGIARYTVYPEAGHNTWTNAFKEPDFISWLLKRTQANLHVKFANPNVCVTNGAGAELMLTEGFPAYQWEYNGTVIPDSSRSSLIADKPGKYRGRFSRVASPSTADWNEWSNQVEIKEQIPEATELYQSGTTYLNDLNGKTHASLKGPEGMAHYYWYRNGTQTNAPDSVSLDLSPGNCGTPCSNAGQYSLVTAGFDNCPSFPSPIKYVFFQNQAPIKNKLRPESFKAEVLTSSSTYLSWSEAPGDETAYEIWRYNTSRPGDEWTMAAIVRSQVTFYKDTMLVPNSIYWYKIRGLNNTSRSDYFPGNSKTDASENLIVNTPADHDRPAPPQNLKALRLGANTIRLNWNSGKDESGMKEYIIDYNGSSVHTGLLDTTYIIKNLAINSTYTFTVKTVDISDNISAASNQVVVNTNMTGLFYKHSTGAWKSLDESSLKDTFDNPEHIGAVANVTLSPRVQEDFFNFEFEGYLYITTAGNYTFYLNSNEGSRLYLDNVEIVDFNGTHGTCSGNASSTTCPNGWGHPSTAIPLSEGPHVIRIRYFEYTGSQALQFRYNGPDTGNTAVQPGDEVFTSGSYTPPSPPSTPSNFSVQSNGMTGIKLSWNKSTGTNVEYEVYRATSSGGPFAIIDRVNTLVFDDFSVVTGKTYYYKLKAANAFGVSTFTSTVSGKTQQDLQAPTQPMGLASTGNSVRTILTWSSSTDNVGIAGYEIWANGKLVGKSDIPGYELYLEPGEIFTFYVIAYDASGNKSSKSATVTNESYIMDAEEPISSSISVDIFPNPGPSDDLKLKVHSTASRPITLHLRDPLNKQILVQTLRAEDFNVEYQLLPNTKLANGVYVLFLEQDGKIIHRKVLVQN